ncbi:MAG: DUF255 domain-containing protein [Candidatus Eisenbacteria bacterium]|uniref:DUF255 domain-containing protein n=1 Tax=Eiseniibacteriota bacterium TaxID=2212470 RepID=A0A933W979_UNCEI|nr:DUF255 domain-containing protein [Candidatus Eisenbacteria bacterium]
MRIRFPLRPLLLALASVALLVASSRPASAGKVDWRSWDDGLARAKSGNRFVVVDVYTDWCGWCRRMEADVYARRDVSEYLDSKFVTVKLNAESGELVHRGERSMSARTLASQFQVTGYPTTIFLRPDGERLANVPGYIPAEKFLLLLRYIGDGHMDRGEKWEDFVAAQPKAN